MVTLTIRCKKLQRVLFYLLCLVLLYAEFNRRFYSGGALYYIPKHLHRYYKFQDHYSPGEDAGALSDAAVGALAAQLERANRAAAVLDFGHRGPVAPDTTVLLVQVGRDAERLQFLIISLGQVHYIQDALLIFSHSYFDDNINSLIRSIHFCKVIQIFYPYSLQLNPRTFPGIDPDDCNSSITQLRDNVTTCFDRDARLTEHKHHWWWKANYVFYGFHWSHKHNGMVVFLEEDDYVLPDFLYMLKYVQRSLSYFPEVEIASFGRTFGKDLDYDLLTIDALRPPYHRGLAFNKTTWQKIISLSSLFCTFNDSSWSYSLLHLFERFPKGYVDMTACLAPRVLSTGLFKSGRQAARAIWWELKRSGLYPSTVNTVALFGRQGSLAHRRTPPPHGNGGWADVRDQLLCLEPFVAADIETPAVGTWRHSEHYTVNTPCYYWNF